MLRDLTFVNLGKRPDGETTLNSTAIFWSTVNSLSVNWSSAEPWLVTTYHTCILLIITHTQYQSELLSEGWPSVVKTHLKRTPLMTCHAFGACCCCCCCCWGSCALSAVCTVWPSVVAAVPLLLTYNHTHTETDGQCSQRKPQWRSSM